VSKPQLFASESYLSASPEVRAQVVNGCGPGGWKFDIIPDKLLGLSIAATCDIHDWDYAVGQTVADKDAADRVFLNNALRTIEAASGWWNRRYTVRNARRCMAWGYYQAVHWFGGPAFWQGKNSPANLTVTV